MINLIVGDNWLQLDFILFLFQVHSWGVNISYLFLLLNIIWSQWYIEIKRSRWDCKFVFVYSTYECSICYCSVLETYPKYFYIMSSHLSCVWMSILFSFPTHTFVFIFNKDFSPWGSIHTNSRQYLHHNVAVAAGLSGCWQANTCNCQIRARVVPLINQGLHYGGCH